MSGPEDCSTVPDQSGSGTPAVATPVDEPCTLDVHHQACHLDRG